MKLDANVLRYLTKEEFRVLTAVEQGQRNVRYSRVEYDITWECGCGWRDVERCGDVE